MKICVVGWYGMNNVGDEAFRVVLTDFFEGHDLDFITPPKLCPPCDMVVLGGGAVVSPFYLNILPKSKIPRYALGVGIEYESELDLLKQYGFRKAYIRNLKDAGYSPPMTQYLPDLAFYFPPVPSPVLKRYRCSKDSKVAAVFLTDYVNPAIDRPLVDFAKKAISFHTSLAAELDWLTEQGWEIVMVPCATKGYGDDRRINLDVAAYMHHPPTLIFDILSPAEMISLLMDCSLAVCMRFHAHIFSMIAGTPFVSLDYTRKVRLLLEECRLPANAGRFVGDVFNVDQFRERINSMIDLQFGTLPLAASRRQMLISAKQVIRREWLGELI